MALASGDTIIKRSGWVSLESSGASVAASSISSAASTECTPTQHEDAPMVEFAVEANFSSGPAQNALVSLLIKVNDLGAASQDAEVPTTTHLHRPLGHAMIKATTGAQYLQIGPVPLPAENFDCYLINGDTNFAMTWKLWVRPWSVAEKA